ncbi:membrane protein [Yersinia pseudotuberculosis]|nr:membrane protein [Yersinia pseudotuberculosis]
MGVGMQDIASDIRSGARFCIIFSIGYRIAESIFKKDYTLTDFIGIITVDMAKIAIASAGSVLVGIALTAFGIVAAFAMVAAGILISMGLDYIDKKYDISGKVITLLKNAIKTRPRTPEANFQYTLNNNFGFK